MFMTKRKLSALLAFAAFPAALFCASAPSWAGPILGDASAFAVFGGAGVTNVGSSVITGELGVSPITSVTGFPPGAVVGGTIHLNDSMAIAAGNAFLSAYTTLGGSTVTQNLTGGTLGVGTLGSLSPGVYKFDSTALLSGALTLDGGSDSNAHFIFIIGSELTTGSASSVVLTNGAYFDNVYWLTGTAAILGSGTAFSGSILAGSKIDMADGANIICGRALAKTAVNLMSTNQVSIDCQQSTPPGGGTSDVPEPASLALFGLGFLGLSGLRLARRRREKAQL